MAPDKRPPEQDSVRTTIVGGRPPGNGKPLGPIPRGIEVLVKKAAVDPEFKTPPAGESRRGGPRDRPCARPGRGADAGGRAAAQLEAIIAQTTVSPRSALPSSAALPPSCWWPWVPGRGPVLHSSSSRMSRRRQPQRRPLRPPQRQRRRSFRRHLRRGRRGRRGRTGRPSRRRPPRRRHGNRPGGLEARRRGHAGPHRQGISGGAA